MPNLYMKCLLFLTETQRQNDLGQVSFHTFDFTDKDDRDNEVKPVFVTVDVKPEYRPASGEPIYTLVDLTNLQPHDAASKQKPTQTAYSPQQIQYPQNPQYPQPTPQQPIPNNAPVWVPATFAQVAQMLQPQQYVQNVQNTQVLQPLREPQYGPQQRPPPPIPYGLPNVPKVQQAQSKPSYQYGPLIIEQEPNIQYTTPQTPNATGNATVDGLAFTSETPLIPINCLKSLCG